MKERKRIFLVVLTILLVTAALIPASAWATGPVKPVTLSWVAGGVGGGWYVQAGGIARLITEKEPNIVIKVVPGGGVVNPVRVSSGKDQLGWGITFVDRMAFRGMAPLYDKPHPNVMAIGGIFGIFHIHFLAAEGRGLKTLADMVDLVKAGKAINVAAPMKGTSDLPIVEFILEAYGISLEDIRKAGGKVFQATYADMVSLYKDRHVDFVFTHLALPGAAITEMTISRPSTLLSVANEVIDKLAKELGTLPRDRGLHVIPAPTYKGLTADTPTVATTGELIISKEVPDEVAYAITRILCQNVSELHALNVANRTFIPERGWANVAVPLHPGAAKFYREAGFMK